jgi:hypothetical protein
MLSPPVSGGATIRARRERSATRDEGESESAPSGTSSRASACLQELVQPHVRSANRFRPTGSCRSSSRVTSRRATRWRSTFATNPASRKAARRYASHGGRNRTHLSPERLRWSFQRMSWSNHLSRRKSLGTLHQRSKPRDQHEVRGAQTPGAGHGSSSTGCLSRACR